MRVILKQNLLVVAPEDADEELALAVWKDGRDGHVLHLGLRGSGLAVTDLGPREVVCREPINITSRSPAPLDVLSNFAATPFTLDGEEYASVESFWQGLKFATRRERREVAQLTGPAARKAGDRVGYGERVEYGGESIVVGTHAHWALMERATVAKFEQNEESRGVLLATAPRPLTHRTRRDSKTIPGVIMADMWMRLRTRLLAAEPEAAADGDEDE